MLYEVGKKVIALKDSELGLYKKHDIREILELKQCSCKELLALDLGFELKERLVCYCIKCQTKLSSDGRLWCDSQNWKPLDEVELSESSLEDVMAEIGILQPEYV